MWIEGYDGFSLTLEPQLDLLGSMFAPREGGPSALLCEPTLQEWIDG